MALVAPEDDDVAGIEDEALPPGRKLDRAALAGQVFARAQLCAGRRPSPPAGGSSIRSISRPGDGLGQQLAHGDLAALAGRQLAARYRRPVRRGGSISSSSRTWSACATLISTASVGLAAPDSRFAQVGARDAGHARDLLLREAARLAQRLDVAAEVQRGRDRGCHSASPTHGRLPIYWQSGRYIVRAGVSVQDHRKETHMSNPIAGQERRWSPEAAAGWAARSRRRWRAAGARVVLVARHAGRAGARSWRRSARRAARRTRSPPTSPTSDATHAIAGQAAAAVGPIDVLVNNASTLGPVPLRLLLDTDCEDLERALAVNLVGPFRLTKAIAGPMVLRGGGVDRQRHLRRGDRGVRALGRVRRVEGGAGAAGARLGGGAGRHRRARPQRRSGRDGHAHARRRDPRRRSAPRWPIRRASPRRSSRCSQAEPAPRAGRARRDRGPSAAEVAP